MDENFDYVKSNEKTLPMLEKIYGDCATDKTATFQVPKNKQMSNNKQSMKLYTEEQVNKAMLDYIQGIPRIKIFNSLTPIELPSDEEIEKEIYSNMDIHDDDNFRNGAKWMRDKIGGINEQQ